MNCRKVCNLLSAYLDGELSGEEQLRVRYHLRECESCSEELNSLQSTKRLISRLASQDPRPGFEENLLFTIHSESNRPTVRFGPRTWWAFLAEPSRERLRTAFVVSTFGAAAILWATMPLRMPAEKQSLALNSASQAKLLAPANLPMRFPMREYYLHRSGEDSQWMNSGPTIITPASDTYSPSR